MEAEEYLALYRSWGLLYWPIFGILNGKCRCGEVCDRPGKHGRTRWSELTESVQPILPIQNVAIACRKGLVAIDVDKTMPPELEPYLGTTYTVRTSRGFHLWFAADPERPVRTIAGWRHGCDVRAVGGLVVAAPSRHISGAEYRWDETSPLHLTPIPDGLALLLPEYRSRTHTDLGDVSDVADEGAMGMEHGLADEMRGVTAERNNALFRLVCTWRTCAAAGLVGKDALAHLALAAMETGLSREEVGRTIQSALR